MQVTNQQILADCLTSFFPRDHIQVNARKSSSFRYSPGVYMELDIWIPNYQICFEFQDPYHYVTTWFYREKIKQKDTIKKSTVRKSQVTLITIPCWWVGDLLSLKATIYFERPDVFFDLSIPPPPDNLPIPLNPPSNYFQSGAIPDVGTLMLASFPKDELFNKSMVPNSWWVGEKYDGFRVCWNPTKKSVYTRSGNKLLFPSVFVLHFPTIFFDGEIWFGRGQFGATSPLISCYFDHVQWPGLRMVLFDVPAWNLQRKTFEKRYKLLLKNCQPHHPFIIVATRTLCQNNAHLTLLVNSTIQHQGEGVILRLVRSLYEHGRSTSLIKLKTAQGDAEAMVVHCGRESVTLGLPDGRTFEVPIDDIACTLPEVSSVVTFSYEKRNQSDMPVAPHVIKIRHDMCWEDVISSFNREKHLNSYSQATSFSLLPSESWAKRIRQYLVSFASKCNLVPTCPNTWYSISVDAFSKFKNVLNTFRGNYYKILKHIFPDVAFDKTSFPSPTSRLQFFLDYAKSHAIDPYKAENWYSQDKQKIMASQGSQMIKFFYNGSIAKALQELFPKVVFDPSKFKKHPLWYNAKNRRKFFEEYARENKFDPLNPKNWYIQQRKKIEAKKGASRVLWYHNDSVSKALLDLFPDIGLEKECFPMFPLWCTPTGRQQFFINYALSQGFDPLVAEHWYDHSVHLLHCKGAARILYHHNLSMAKALLDLFPDIGLDAKQFPKTTWTLKKHK
eukprot:Phypoly_transcript_03394.p1 GENE.Phypoly_transcript_03394~~Phypoly_transcript_03394.p1  ORF type:complete len:728 (+),score=54.40 Phypoly_transcript_03394:224-2407(+)